MTLTSLVVNDQTFAVEESRIEASKRTILVDGKQIQVEILKELGRNPLELLVRVDGRILHITVAHNDQGEFFPVRLNGKPLKAALGISEEYHISRDRSRAQEGPVIVTAPMAGRIASLKVTPGTPADEGQPLVVLEAMKMENEVASPKKGLVKEIYVQAGDLVKAGDKLALVD